jgi:hypothetical protein
VEWPATALIAIIVRANRLVATMETGATRPANSILRLP